MNFFVIQEKRQQNALSSLKDIKIITCNNRNNNYTNMNETKNKNNIRKTK